jgi:hypothetical protein
MKPTELQPTIRYDKMVEKALRGVVTQALDHVVKNGLPNDHHFYITFMTDFPGVEIPPYLREQYPEEMTIVLQYQFYGLEALEDKFQVTLSFNNTPERLIIPVEAVTIFADPSVNFALQFQPMEDIDDEEDFPPPPPPAAPTGGKKGAKKTPVAAKEKKDSGDGKVIALDKFRKK